MDVRLALRSFRRAPWSAATVAVALGLGIGAATTTYTVFNHVVFRPVPGVAEPDQLVTLYYQVDPTEPHRAAASYAHLVAMREGSPALDGLAAWSQHEAAFGLDPSLAPGMIDVTAVTRGYFELLGVRARMGRLFGADEYDDASPVLVVSEHFVRDQLAGDPAPVGRQVYVNGRAFIGVVATTAVRTGSGATTYGRRGAPRCALARSGMRLACSRFSGGCVRARRWHRHRRRYAARRRRPARS